MSLYKYPKFKILIDPKSRKTQGLRVGDVVRRQYFDMPNIIYSLMIVTDTGIDMIGGEESAYFTGALIEGDEPKTGEILDFVRVTNLFDTDRGGALYLTASDSEAPFMDVIDGLAVENSLCFPYMAGGKSDVPDMNKYACLGEEYLAQTYKQNEQEASRIFRITRNAKANTGQKLGFKQSIEKPVENPQRLVISYKIRASKTAENVPVSFGYTNGAETDGSDAINIKQHWEYKLHLITVDYPAKYRRSFTVELTNHLTGEGDWCEIADLNIVLQSDIATFANSTKARIGKVSGIIDPVFGILEGYGAYFQNMYATKNVNIAGTLTAGDEAGFSSTFYVGKIHKNVILNSIDAIFDDPETSQVQDKTPVGIGKAWMIGNAAKLQVQSANWRDLHVGKKYCFSLWVKADEASNISVFQDEHYLEDIRIETTGEWRRHHVYFVIKESGNTSLMIGLQSDTTGILITAPQLEAGSISQYQPTDGTLSYVEDYGAWFNKGGIGGTIQNPLLRLNEDGSISSRDRSFVINPDGTGHFASGRFKWTKDTITLQDVTIRWEDFDEDVKDSLKPKSVSLTGTDTFHYPDELETTCEPTEIYVFATETGFTATTRKWEYLDSNTNWKTIPGNLEDFIRIVPNGHYWEGRNVLTIKYTGSIRDEQYFETYTIHKQYDGVSAFSVYIDSSQGNVFRNGVISTILKAIVFKGGEDITNKLPENNFKWTRISENAGSDERWNSTEHIGKTLAITQEDVFFKAVFDCEIIIKNQ